MKKILNKLSGLIFVFIIIVALVIYSYDENSITVSTGAISNTKIGWGIKRNDNHSQPDLRKEKFRINK